MIRPQIVFCLATLVLLLSASAYSQPTPQPTLGQKNAKNVQPESSASPNRAPTADKDIALQASASEKDLNRLVAIAEEWQKKLEQPEKSAGLLKRLDDSLDTTLAATLAGLSIAAATFLISFTAPLAQKIKEVNDRSATPGAADTARLKKMKTGVNQLMLAFYVFVGFMVESLTLDQWDEPGSWLPQYGWKYPDVILAGGALVVGMWLLGKGARTIKSIVDEVN